MPCRVEILSVGNELLLGNTVNTNASWIAKHITTLGGSVTRIATVPDVLPEISSALQESIRRKPEFIITTGGIGPTFDDMTLAGVAKALNMRLMLNKRAVDMIKAHYSRRFPDRRLSLSKPRLKMARIPAGSIPVRNPVGTAPAVQVNWKGVRIFCLPGVPKEAKAIFLESIQPAIRARSGGLVFAERWLKIQGIMESSIAPLIDKVMARWPGVYVKSHPRGIEAGGRPRLELHFSTTARDHARADNIILKASKELSSQLRKEGARITIKK